MAKLQKFRDYHYESTAKVSDNTRTLAISAIAIIWLFKVQVGTTYQVPNGLKIPLLLVFLAMALDFFQYVYRSIVWHYIFRAKEVELEKNKITEDSELYVSASINLVAYIFFYTKVVALTFAYIYLISYLFQGVKWV